VAAIDFPTPVVVGEEFTSGGQTWVWTGLVWEAKRVTPTGPTGPQGIQGPTGATGAQGATGPYVRLLLVPAQFWESHTLKPQVYGLL